MVLNVEYSSLGWGGTRFLTRESDRQPYFVEIIEYSVSKSYLDKELLYQKYVVEGLTCEEISSEFGTARTTVLKYLKCYEIPVRKKLVQIKQGSVELPMVANALKKSCLNIRESRKIFKR